MFEDLGKLIAILFCLLLLGFLITATKVTVVLGAELVTPAQELVKTTDSPVVYAILEGKKHQIIDEYTFLSYGYEWGDIKIVSNEKLNSYPRARLAKSLNNPTVYYFDDARRLKKEHLTEHVFVDYGNKWEDVITLNQIDLSKYANVKFAKTAGESKIFCLQNGKRRDISSEEMINSNEIMVVSQFDLQSYPFETSVQGSEIQLATYSPTSNGVLKLSLSPVSSMEKVVPTGTVSEFAKIDLINQEGTIEIEYLTVSAFGVITDQDIQAVYLIDAEDNTFNYKSYLNGKKALFKFYPALTLTPGERITLTIKAALNSSAGMAYRSVSFGIIDSKDIGTNAQIRSQFPIQGSYKQMRHIDGVLGKAEISSLPISANITAINKGAQNQNVANFKISEISGKEDILLKKISFRIQGNIDYTNLINIDLVDEKGKVLTTAAWLQKNKTVSFNLEENPYKIERHSSKNISLRADIIGAGEREFRFLIEYPEDTIIIGASSGYEFLPIASSEEAGYPIGFRRTNNYNKFIINKGTILTYLDKDSPKEIIAGSTSAVLAVMEIRASNADIKLKNMNLKVDYTGMPLNGDIEFINTDTEEIFFRIGADMLFTNKNIEMHLSPAQSINVGERLKFEIRADVPKEVNVNATYLFTLSNFAFENIPDGTYDVKNTTLSSNLLTTKTAILDIVPKELSENYIAGAKNVKLGKFIIQSNYAEDIYIEGISIKSQEGYDIVSHTNGFYNLKIKLGGRTATVEQPLSLPTSFTFTKYKIRAGSYATLEIYSDTYPIASGQMIAMSVADIRAYGADSQEIPIINGIGKNSSAAVFSAIDLIIERNDNFAGGSVGCDEDIKIGSFKVIANSTEDIYLKKIGLEPIAGSDNISYANHFTNFKLVNNKTNKTLASIQKPTSGLNSFSRSIKIESGETLIIDIYVDMEECRCAGNIQLSIKSIEAYGYSSKVSPAINNLPLTLQANNCPSNCE